MPRARIEVRQRNALSATIARLPGLSQVPVMARPGRQVQIEATVRNLSTRPFPAQATYGRRLVRLGAQLCDRNRNVINRDFERAWLPATLPPGESMEVPMTITAPAEPGRYALKFDLVSEGIDWFEACGSQTTTRTMIVI
jgi:hypothetical protein